MALSHIEAESSTLKHLERGNHSDCDSDNGSENKMTSVAIWASKSQGSACADPWICKGPPVRTRGFQFRFNLDSRNSPGTLQKPSRNHSRTFQDSSRNLRVFQFAFENELPRGGSSSSNSSSGNNSTASGKQGYAITIASAANEGAARAAPDRA